MGAILSVTHMLTLAKQSTTCTCTVLRKMFIALQSLDKLRWEDSNPWVSLQLAGSFSSHIEGYEDLNFH